MLFRKSSSAHYSLSCHNLHAISHCKKFNGLRDISPLYYLVPFLSLSFSPAALAAQINDNQSVHIQISDDGQNNSVTNERATVTLDVVTVNARGITEDALDTPFVVDTVTAQEIEDRQYVTLKEVMRDEPSIDAHDGGSGNPSYAMLWMRGIGSLSNTSLDDNSVDIRVDGVSNGKMGLARNLIDVEKVEVSKGPQGTILGSSAEAGSVSVKTYDPVEYVEAKATVGLGSDDQRYGEAMLNLPINDNFAFRIAGMSEKRDNILERREDGKPLNEQKKQGVQAKLGWHDDDYLNSAILTAYFDEQTNNVPVLQQDFDTYKVATSGLPHDSKNTTKGASLSITSEMFDFADIESKTGYYHYDNDILRPYIPPEMLPLQFRGFQVPEEQQPIFREVLANPDSNLQYLDESVKQVSQELRLVSKPESDIQWVAGLYYAKKDREWKNDARMDLSDLPDSMLKNSTVGGANNAVRDRAFDTTTKAIFGEVTYPAMDNLDVIAGIRVANEKQKNDTVWYGNSNNPLASDTPIKFGGKTLDETKTTGRLGLSYALTPDWRVYALQSRGHKFGGFPDYDTNVAYGFPVDYYKPTKIDASEIGTKYRSADNRLSLDLALFYNKMKDERVTVLATPPEYRSETANVDTRSQGAEVSANWRMTDNWQLKTQLAYTDTEVTDASDVPAPARPGMLPLTAEGNQMPQVPKWSGSLGVRYSDEVPFLMPIFNNSTANKSKWFVDASYRYVGDRYAEANNGIELDSYGLVDASIGLISDNHEFSIWGKNLTDEKYEYFKIYPMQVGTLAPDRSYGMKYSYYY